MAAHVTEYLLNFCVSHSKCKSNSATSCIAFWITQSKPQEVPMEKGKSLEVFRDVKGIILCYIRCKNN